MSVDLFNYQARYGENTNFGFKETSKTEYLTSSLGKKFPYELYSATARFKAPQQKAKSKAGLEPLEKSASDFALMERQFSRYKALDFMSGSILTSISDVAWLFRELESEAVEHTFLVYQFKDSSYLVQHLSSGGLSSAVVDLRLLAGHVHKLSPESITLVHNHPSGQLISSRQDQQMLSRLRLAFENTKVEVKDGLVLNLRSGQYLVFGTSSDSDRIFEHQDPKRKEKQVPVYSFNKQLFCVNYQPDKITNPEQTAAYLSAQKFGLSDRTEALILNNANEIMGKFILPQNKQYEKLVELLSRYGGTSAILYGNSLSERLFERYKTKLANLGFSALDGIRLESGNYYSLLNHSKITLREELVQSYHQKKGKETGNMRGKEQKGETSVLERLDVASEKEIAPAEPLLPPRNGVKR
ncbi:JAB domain-containing protein [Chryseobacterium sp. A301]